jgi:DNA-binding NarL/FixJ family response regulator
VSPGDVWHRGRQRTVSGAAPSRLALVEDHDRYRDVLRDVVGMLADVAVAWEAVDGLSALEHFEREAVDLAVIDVSLPRLNGIELIARVTERWPDTVCVAVSGHTEPSFVERAFGAGALAYVLKGRPGDLRDGIGAALAGARYLSPRLESRFS